MAYILLLVYMVMGCLVIKNKFCLHKAELTWICIGLFVFFAFRSPATGTDTQGYCEYFLYVGKNISSIKEVMLFKPNEQGFYVFMWLLYKVVPYQQALLIVHAAILSICYGKFVSRFSTDYLVSTICFLTIGMSFHLTGMRQSIAMSFCMIAYIYMYDKKYIRSAFFILLGFVFHMSALIFVLAFIFGVIWKKNNNLLTTGVIAILVSLSVERILAFITKLNEKWINYAEIEYTDNGFIFFMVLIAMEIVMAIASKSLKEDDHFHIRVSYLAVILWAGRLVTRTFERASLFFFPAFEVEMPNTMAALSMNNRKVVKPIFLIGMCLLYAWRMSGRYYAFFFS